MKACNASNHNRGLDPASFFFKRFLDFALNFNILSTKQGHRRMNFFLRCLKSQDRMLCNRRHAPHLPTHPPQRSTFLAKINCPFKRNAQTPIYHEKRRKRAQNKNNLYTASSTKRTQATEFKFSPALPLWCRRVMQC